MMSRKFEQKHPSYLSHAAVQDAPRKKNGVFALKRRAIAPAQPDSQDPIVTGRYQDTDGGCTIAINQAGFHIECWYALVEPYDGTNTRYWAHWGGDRRTGSSDFDLYEHPKSQGKSVGVLQVSGDKLFLHARGELVRLECLASRPTLSEGAIRSMPGSEEDLRFLLYYERFPFTRQYTQWLERQLGDRIIPLLESYFSAAETGVRVDDRIKRIARAKRIDEHVQDTFSTTPGTGWNPADIPLAQLYGKRAILSRGWSWKGEMRSIRDWLRIVAQRCSADRLVGSQGDIVLESIYRHLGIGASRILFKYKVSISAIGGSVDFGVGYGAWAGELVIAKLICKEDENGKEVEGEHVWTQKYPLDMTAFSMGGSLGYSVTLETEGSGLSEIDYEPEDIVGTFYMFDVSGTAVMWGRGTTAMVIRGRRRSYPELAIDMSGASTKLGLAVGIEAGFTTGVIGEIQTKRVRKSELSEQPTLAIVNQETACHFRLGDSFLTEEGWEYIRSVAALELALFSSEHSVLKVDGHADRIDEKERNLELSKFRAKNTVQALKDVLGTQFRIRPENIVIRGHGEHEAEEEGQPDGKGDPGKRRVDVRIEGRVILSLLGQ